MMLIILIGVTVPKSLMHRPVDAEHTNVKNKVIMNNIIKFVTRWVRGRWEKSSKGFSTCFSKEGRI